MTTPFEAQQRLYYTRQINRGVPTVSAPSRDTLIAAVSTDNAGLGPTAASLLSDFGQGTQNILTADAACRSLVVPNPAMRDSGARTGCGWWFVADPTRRSTGALGTRRGPMSPTLDTAYGPGTWMWDPAEAEAAERLKRASTIPSCADVVNNGNPDYAWCQSTNRAVPVDPASGTVRYPTQSGGDCVGTIVRVSDGVAACNPPPPNSSAAGAAASSTSALCTGSPLSPACLYSIIGGQGSQCTVAGTLATALSGNTYATGDDTFNRTYAVMARQFTLNEGTYATGNTTQQQVLTDINNLAAFANNTQQSPLVTMAARKLCSDSTIDLCSSYGPSDVAQFDLECIRRYAISKGFAANAGLLARGDSYWNDKTLLPNWQAIMDNVHWYKTVADTPPGPTNLLNQPKSSSADDIQTAYQVQRNAIFDVYGITLPTVELTCPPYTPSS